MVENYKNRTAKHWLVLMIVSIMFAANAGIINNVIGVFYTPVSESVGIFRGSFALHHTISSLMVGIVSLIVPKTIKQFGWKRMLILGVALSFIGTAGMGLTNRLIIFYVLGAVRGIGAAFFGMVPMAMLINNWFDKKNGFAMSIASGFSGFIGMIFAPIFANIISTNGWRISFLIMGLTIVLFALPAIVYPYTVKPENECLLPYGNENQRQDDRNEEKSNIKVTKKDIIISFVALIIFSLLHTNILGINQHLSSYGESIGMSLEFSGYMISAVMLGNICFKLVIGPLSDKIGAVKATITMNIVNVIGLLIFILFNKHILSIFGAFLFGSVFSVGSVSLPLISNQFFGKKLSEEIFPVLTLTSSIGSAISNTLVGYLFDFTGSYEISFLLAIAFHVINLGMLFIASKNSIKNI